jgi:rhodanese-related sulfurtransferase/signal-transduction protein with cAMP-binding, CBS, and nucleotidyltransferase domain
MAHAPLISAEMFDYLRNQGIEPYTKLDDYVREQLGDGVRVVSLFAGERLSTRKPVQRVTVLSGTVRLDPSGALLTLESTRDHAVLTEDSESQLVAETDTVLLLVDAGFLDTLSSWAELAAYARQTGGDELARRLLAVRHTVSFNQLPLEHVIQALQQMTPKTVKAGEAVVTQGEKGDAFYVIRTGRAEVWKAGIYDDEQKRVDTMGPGDSFGDEALVTGGTRNATVKMVEDGELLVLGATAFRELMSQPLLAEVAPETVPTLFDEGWKAVDVRYEEEFEDGHIPGALHLPLPELRQRVDAMLDKSGKYITVCLSGKRSSVAAFLLTQRGYDVVSMKGGMSSWQGEQTA